MHAHLIRHCPHKATNLISLRLAPQKVRAQNSRAQFPRLNCATEIRPRSEFTKKVPPRSHASSSPSHSYNAVRLRIQVRSLDYDGVVAVSCAKRLGGGFGDRLWDRMDQGGAREARDSIADSVDEGHETEGTECGCFQEIGAIVRIRRF